MIPPHPWWMREGRSYESIRSARDCFVHVQIHISIYRDEECPPQKRRALGYFVAEVGTPSWVYSRRCFHFTNEAGSHLRIKSKLTCRPPDTSPQRRIRSLREKIALSTEFDPGCSRPQHFGEREIPRPVTKSRDFFTLSDSDVNTCF